MNHYTETGRSIILRIKVIQGLLTKNVAMFGKMNPFIEIV